MNNKYDEKYRRSNQLLADWANRDKREVKTVITKQDYEAKKKKEIIDSWMKRN